MNTKKCLICNLGGKNDVLNWHIDPDSGGIWCWCCSCDRGYSLIDYCHNAGVTLAQFLKQDFDFIESTPNEVTRMEWPQHFVPLSDPRAKIGLDYLENRGLSPIGDMYFDIVDKGIVFPYYFDSVFCGAQVRFCKTRKTKDGDAWKITTLPGTRLGLVIYAYNQKMIMPHVKGFIVCEGAFNALSIQQSLDKMYGGQFKNPFKAVACSGSGSSAHQLDVFKSLKEQGYKVICAPDNDKAGKKMLEKFIKNESATHYAFTEDEKDWNDRLISQGGQEFAKYFLGRVTKI